MTIPASAVRQAIENLVGSVENTVDLPPEAFQLMKDGYRQLIEDILPHDLAVIDRIMKRYLLLD